MSSDDKDGQSVPELGLTKPDPRRISPLQSTRVPQYQTRSRWTRLRRRLKPKQNTSSSLEKPPPTNSSGKHSIHKPPQYLPKARRVVGGAPLGMPGGGTALKCGWAGVWWGRTPI
ncbi:hypothetical protein O181_093523 [Austropuccinia psidii MF-1]|uniref:Uncharacterized protein n=1 Tax=Austropuccinia psidii MF-1 TaxID=1389203 RepID=A0A9Q3J0F3_9BASI|nr:hypothetical protein [Austropuccinia psidii MF-1]